MIYKTDGNILLSQADGSSIWQSGTVGQSTGSVQMQTDGNLVIYYGGPNAIWKSR